MVIISTADKPIIYEMDSISDNDLSSQFFSRIKQFLKSKKV